jgi:ABC-type arginine/histidine transport system permease subunit
MAWPFALRRALPLSGNAAILMLRALRRAFIGNGRHLAAYDSS